MRAQSSYASAHRLGPVFIYMLLYTYKARAHTHTSIMYIVYELHARVSNNNVGRGVSLINTHLLMRVSNTRWLYIIIHYNTPCGTITRHAECLDSISCSYCVCQTEAVLSTKMSLTRASQ